MHREMVKKSGPTCDNWNPLMMFSVNLIAGSRIYLTASTHPSALPREGRASLAFLILQHMVNLDYFPCGKMSKSLHPNIVVRIIKGSSEIKYFLHTFASCLPHLGA